MKEAVCARRKRLPLFPSIENRARHWGVVGPAPWVGSVVRLCSPAPRSGSAVRFCSLIPWSGPTVSVLRPGRVGRRPARPLCRVRESAPPSDLVMLPCGGSIGVPRHMARSCDPGMGPVVQLTGGIPADCRTLPTKSGSEQAGKVGGLSNSLTENVFRHVFTHPFRRCWSMLLYFRSCCWRCFPVGSSCSGSR